MKKSILYSFANCFLITLCCFLTVSCAKDIVDVNGSIEGIVKDQESGALIANCQVSLSPVGKSVLTSDDGLFSFGGLEPGAYTLTFKKAGYDDASRTTTVTSGQTNQLSITMKAKSSFTLSESKLNFGDMSSSLSIYLFNNSDQSCSFTVNNVPKWATFSHITGSVSASNSTFLNISVNRDAVDYGTYSQIVSIDYKGKASGTVTLALEMKKVQLTSPTISISTSAEDITQNSFSIGGKIEATGGAEITSYGHCWSLTENPTTNGNKTDNGSIKDITEFKSEIKDLTPGSTYYVRAYATNQYGTAYSQQIVVTTQDVASNKWDGNIATSFDGGDGSAGNPYKISTGGQLLLMKDYNTSYFTLEANIDLNNHNWLPFEFKGNLDSKDHVISNLYIKRTDNGQGLFSTLVGTVKNMTIKGVKIEANGCDYIGVLAGAIKGGSGTGRSIVNNVNIVLLENSNIMGRNYVGGFVGHIGDNRFSVDYVNVENCSVSSVSSSNNPINGNNHVGGMIGENEYAHISFMKASVNVNGASCVGGIVGSFNSSYNEEIIEKCGFSGSIKGTKYAGGIVGETSYSSSSSNLVVSCYAHVQIEADEYAGGVIGYSDWADIVACYSTGKIKGVSRLCGLIGGGRGFHANLCYSTVSSTSSNFDAFGANCKDCATTAAKTSSSLTNSVTNCKDITSHLKTAYSGYAKYWNFDSTWIWTGEIEDKQYNVSCPKLAWE